MKTKVKNTALSSLFCLAMIILIVTVSIALPIYFRPFYFWQIEPLEIPEYTGESVENIKAAFNELMDYLTLPGKEFSTGVFKYSEEGKSHFVDCKALFDLNIIALIIAAAIVVALKVCEKKRLFKLLRPMGIRMSAWAGATTLTVFALLAALVSIDFDRAFVIFHGLFFPGKDNWLFDPRTDEIINALPETFFMNCAILIASSVIILSVALIIRGVILKKRADSQDMR